MRITAGVCVLAAGLLFGAGGAIASADPESGGGATSGSAEATQGSSAESQGAGASNATVGSAASTQPGITLRIPGLARLAPSRPGRFNRPTSIVRGGVDRDAKQGTASQDGKAIATKSETKPAVESATAPGAEAQQTTPGAESQTTSGAEAQETGAAPATQELATETEPGTEAPVQTVPADTSGTSKPAAEPTVTTQSVTAPVSPIDDPVQPVSKTVGPITNALVTINGAVATWSESLVALQTSRTPVIDAIISLETMLTTVADAVVQVPGDFSAMLGIPASAGRPQSLIGGSGSLHGRQLSAPADGPLVGPHAGGSPHTVAPADRASLFGTMAPPRPVPGKVASTVFQPLSVSGTVPLRTAATPVSAKSIFEHVIEAVLVPASLTALAAVALPGVGALLVVAAAGVRLGYRQAKAGLALRASGIARFAGPGPLGIARSASMVALRQRARGPRTKRAVCPEVAREARTLERVGQVLDLAAANAASISVDVRRTISATGSSSSIRDDT